MALSCMSSVTLEEVAREAKEQWIQLYVWRDRGLTRSVIERASAAGYSALMVTVDTQVFGQRERDVRNGATVPPRVTVRNAVDVVTRFPWFAQLARHPRIEYANYVDFTRGVPRRLSVSDFVRAQLDPSLCWDDLEWIRSLWDGPLIVKGIMSANDARRAAVNGVDAIVVSNHGGRQLDSLPATLEVLPEIVDAVQGEMEVLLDGGIRRGADVVKAVALGARACMIGRAYLWGLAVAGEAGARKVVSMLKAEIEKTLMLLGTPTIAELDRSAIRQADRNLQPLS
jgi:L-lactate dehydrogenase (cytochrome)